METFCVLLGLLIVARVCGEFAVRAGMPTLVGELVGGILYGAFVANNTTTFLHLVGATDGPGFRVIADLAIFFVMLQAGMELQPGELIRGGARSVSVAMGGVILPLITGIAIGWLLIPAGPGRLEMSLFLGIALSITDVPVSVRVLRELGQLHGASGRVIVGAAVVDDIFGLGLLTLLAILIETGATPSPADYIWLLARIVLFFSAAIFIGRHVIPWIARRLSYLREEEHEFSALLIAGFGYAALAEALGLHYVMGAFLAGLFVSRQALAPNIYDEVSGRVAGITSGFLAPVFFASIGARLDPAALASAPGFTMLVVAAAIVSKLIGCGLPAVATGASTRTALGVGVAMGARGTVALVAADVATTSDVLNPDGGGEYARLVYDAILVMAVLTTVITPILLKVILVGDHREPVEDP